MEDSVTDIWRCELHPDLTPGERFPSDGGGPYCLACAPGRGTSPCANGLCAVGWVLRDGRRHFMCATCGVEYVPVEGRTTSRSVEQDSRGGWHWFCLRDGCRWSGMDLLTEDGANREADRHDKEFHS